MWATVNKLLEYLALARQYEGGSGSEGLKTFARVLYARWRYGLPASMFGAFGLMNKPLSSLREVITGDERRVLLAAFAPPAWRFLEEDKLAFYQRCRDRELPACPITAVFTNNESAIFRAKEMGIPVARTASDMQHIFAQLIEIDGILKRADGGKGSGIYPIEARGGIVSPRREYGNAQELFTWLLSTGFRFYWMIQPRLRPHPELLSLMPGPGLGTVRIISFRKKSGKVTLKWPILKVPAPGAITDNWGHGGTGTIMAEVNVETGRVEKAAGKRKADFPVERFESHPVSAERICGRKLPHWEDLCQLVERSASAFKELPVLGWDVGITQDGPVLIEANWEFGLDMAQGLQGAGLRREFMTALEGIRWDL
jgi:hypothetical protein